MSRTTIKSTKNQKITIKRKQKRPLLYALANNDTYQYLCVEKTQKVFLQLIKGLLAFGVEKSDLADLAYNLNYVEYEEQEGRKRLVVRNILLCKDRRFHFSGKDYSIDVVVGGKKIFLIAFVPVAHRLRLLSPIINACVFIKTDVSK